MADFIDDAQKLSDLFLKAALSKRAAEGPTPVGTCHNCGESLTRAGARWCDKDCREDWERAQRAEANARTRDTSG